MSTIALTNAIAIKYLKEPGHDGLCLLEQGFLLKAVLEDLDFANHMKIVLDADQAFRKVKTVKL